MSFSLWLLVLGCILLTLGLASAYLRLLPVSTSFIYLLFGLAIGPAGLHAWRSGLADISGWFEHLSEAALLISLFIGGLKLRLPLRSPAWTAAWLLAGPVLLGCILGLTLGAHFLFGLDWGLALLVAAILAPTDPVLASDIQVNHAGDDDRLRYAVSGEAGLNDGIAFPFVIAALLLIGQGGGLPGEFDRSGLEAIDPDTLVGDLGIGHQQMVEIARNLIGDCRLLILDEPTAMLTAREVDMLFEQVERLRERGVAIVYISHRLEELARISQRIAVLRDGRLVCVEPIERYDADQLVTLMVGRELGERFDLGPRQTGAPLLRVERLSRRGKVHEVSFEVRAGEIFGISGLIGSGRTELLRLIYGADRADGGQVLLGDPPQRLSLRSPADSVRQGVALITEDRKGEGLLLDQSISANLALGNLPALAR
ncbi:cation:proton antiporter, partial [Pseudomonas aeruginosa]|nr:cation:proton antiporter [Pseudomonas aeruginosa]